LEHIGNRGTLLALTWQHLRTARILRCGYGCEDRYALYQCVHDLPRWDVPDVPDYCNHVAQWMPDGNPLCYRCATTFWYCKKCRAQLPEEAGGWEVTWYCASCAEDYFRCTWCGASCVDRQTALDSAPGDVCEACLDAHSPGWREA